MSGVNNPYRYQYEHVAASQTAQVLGTTGAVGDYLHRIVITVATAASALVRIVDGSGTGILTHTILPNSPGDGIGVYNVEINAVSQDGAWKITTGAGSEVMAVGIFSA
tara:strand:- start:4200 stop:4523 length:324 start_codon:yes stop_codon:yes gene_type:complete